MKKVLFILCVFLSSLRAQDAEVIDNRIRIGKYYFGYTKSIMRFHEPDGTTEEIIEYSYFFFDVIFLDPLWGIICILIIITALVARVMYKKKQRKSVQV